MIFYTGEENGPFSIGSFNITKSSLGPFIADQVSLYILNNKYITVSGYKTLDSGERAGVALTFLNKEGTFTGNFGNPDLPPWGSYKIGNWGYMVRQGETTHTYLEKPEHATGKFRFIVRLDGADVECEGDFNVQKHADPYP